jgi:hypothetical protein
MTAFGLAPLQFVGAYTLDEPRAGSTVVSNADPVAARGNTNNLGETVTIKMMKGGALQASKNATAPPQDIKWDTEFAMPSGGWEVRNDWTCELWAGSPSAKKKSNGFSVIP